MNLLSEHYNFCATHRKKLERKKQRKWLCERPTEPATEYQVRQFILDHENKARWEDARDDWQEYCQDIPISELAALGSYEDEPHFSLAV